MLKIVLALAALLTVAGCQEARTKVLIGGTVIASPGAAPIEDSIVVVTGGTIRGVGLRKDVGVPQDSQRVDMVGKWLVPGGATPLAEGQPASINILDHAPTGGNDAPVRRMTAGNWAQ